MDYSDKQNKSISHRRRYFSLMVIIFVTVCGVLTKYYSGPAAGWVNNSLGGIFYVIFWCQIIHLLWPDLSPLPVSLVVLIITCAIEFTQLSHMDALEYVRRTFAGRALIGNSFNPGDFPYYIAGATIAWVLQHFNRTINNQTNKRKSFE